MDFSNQTTKTKKQGCLTLKFSVIISYIISLTSNLLLLTILFLTGHLYKWIGLIIHLFIIFCSLSSLKNLISFNNRNLLKYKSYTSYFTLVTIIGGTFYIIIIIYSFVTKVDMELIYFYTFCIIIWCIFHYLFITIIYSFIRALEDRPGQTGVTSNLIDKNLKELMVNS